MILEILDMVAAIVSLTSASFSRLHPRSKLEASRAEIERFIAVAQTSFVSPTVNAGQAALTWVLFLPSPFWASHQSV